MLLGKRFTGRQVTCLGMLLLGLSSTFALLHPERWMSEDWSDGIRGFLLGIAITTMLLGIVRLRREGGRL